MNLNPLNVSSELACVYELTPGLNNDNPILHIFNTDDEADSFWDQGIFSHRTDIRWAQWLCIPKHASRYNLDWNKESIFKCTEPLWLYVSHYNGCTNETICTATLLKWFIDEESKNPYFERAEIFPLG